MTKSTKNVKMGNMSSMNSFTWAMVLVASLYAIVILKAGCARVKLSLRKTHSASGYDQRTENAPLRACDLMPGE
jgi:hypothetical protein